MISWFRLNHVQRGLRYIHRALQYIDVLADNTSHWWLPLDSRARIRETNIYRIYILRYTHIGTLAGVVEFVHCVAFIIEWVGVEIGTLVVMSDCCESDPSPTGTQVKEELTGQARTVLHDLEELPSHTAVDGNPWFTRLFSLSSLSLLSEPYSTDTGFKNPHRPDRFPKTDMRRLLNLTWPPQNADVPTIHCR